MSLSERYEIQEQLMSGMTADIYAAVDEKMGRRVAVRRLFPSISIERCRECRPVFNQVFGNLSSLRSSGLLQVIDGGLDDEGYFLVTELLSGPLIGDRLAKQPLSIMQFGEFAKSLLGTIAELHAHNIYHTAISSRSVQLTHDAVKGVRFKIVDLGLAPLIRSLDSERKARHYGMVEPVLMPPEYYEGKLPTQSLDLYSCGQLLYASLAGGHPLGELGLDKIYERLKEGEYPPVHAYRTDVPEEVGEWIQKMTAFHVRDRFPTVQAALDAFPDPPRLDTVRLVRTTRRHVLKPSSQQPGYGGMGTAPVRVAAPFIQNRVPLKPMNDNTLIWVLLIVALGAIIGLVLVLMNDAFS